VDLESEPAGEFRQDTDKVVGTRRRIVKRIDATDLLRSFARECALSVVHLWDAPPVVVEYLKTGDPTLREAAAATAWAAGAAGAAAAGSAAWSAEAAAAVWAAAGSAAWSAEAAAAEAAWSAEAAGAGQRKRFADLVDEAFS
jgi:hypothetical protein